MIEWIRKIKAISLLLMILAFLSGVGIPFGLSVKKPVRSPKEKNIIAAEEKYSVVNQKFASIKLEGLLERLVKNNGNVVQKPFVELWKQKRHSPFFGLDEIKTTANLIDQMKKKGAGIGENAQRTPTVFPDIFIVGVITNEKEAMTTVSYQGYGAPLIWIWKKEGSGKWTLRNPPNPFPFIASGDFSSAGDPKIILLSKDGVDSRTYTNQGREDGPEGSKGAEKKQETYDAFEGARN